MIRNYLKTAWRNLFKNKFFSALNILGLALGLACSVLILLWVQNELNVDSFNANGPRLYTVYERQYYDHKVVGQYATPGILADEMKKMIPDVEYATNANLGEIHTFQVKDKILKLEGGYAGADFFKMFSYPLLQGKTQTALNSISCISISKKMAVNFFGSPQAALGRSIRYDNQKDFIISAVFDDVPENSSDKFEYMINWDQFLLENSWAKSWDSNGPATYVLLKANANAAAVNKKLARFMDTYNKPQPAFREEIGIQKFDEVYLHSNFKNGQIDGGRIEYVHLFTIVAIFILLIACINFMNLTTARSIKRAREIGVRKVVGAVRSVLIKQFIGEAVMLTFIAAMLSVVLVMLLLPVFNMVTLKQITFPYNHSYFWLGMLGLTLITGFISGSYPALFLSSFNPVSVLKGGVRLGTGAAWFRKGLVVFQFVLSILLIISTIVISRQVNYIQTKNLGYDKENLVFVPLDGDLPAKYETFKNEALRMPGIQTISRITARPTNFGSSTGNVFWEGKDPNLVIEFTQVSVGYDFTKTMKLEMADGRDFSRVFATDSGNYLVNETALKRIGYKDPIGKPITMWGRTGKIVGVLKDFHFQSMRNAIQPLIIRLHEHEPFGNLLVRTQPGQTKQALASIEKLCKQLNPNFTFTYSLLDEDYQKLYRNEQVVGKLSNSFAFLAIFISCLGLLGLAMFTAEQRVKEIGIRKVLGASVASLFALLSRDFLFLVVIALVLASPIAYYAMNAWLRNYEYHTKIEWWMFALSAILSIVIALITISFQSIKAALMNPVKSLRSE